MKILIKLNKKLLRIWPNLEKNWVAHFWQEKLGDKQALEKIFWESKARSEQPNQGI